MYEKQFSEWVVNPRSLNDALQHEEGPFVALWLVATWIERLQQRDRSNGTMPIEWIEAIVSSSVRQRMLESGVWNEIQNVAYIAMEMEVSSRKQSLWGDLVEGVQRNSDVLNAHEYMMLVGLVTSRIQDCIEKKKPSLLLDASVSDR
jgi:hypothetical protein